MCLLLFSTKHQRYRLIILSNRDEFFDRSTLPLGWWRPEGSSTRILAGRDSLRGGIWLGINDEGKFSALTNFRTVEEQARQEPTEPSEDVVIQSARSRGLLTLQYLQSRTLNPRDFVDQLVRDEGDDGLRQYGGFSLICGSLKSFQVDGMRVISNARTPASINTILKSGEEIFGGCCELTNSEITTPWPKSQRGKILLDKVVQDSEEADSKEDFIRLLFNLLHDTQFTDEEIQTKSSGELLHDLRKSIFVPKLPILKGYGTRQQTVVLVSGSDDELTVEMIERTIDLDGTVSEVREQLRL